jgi:hypothetical protein
VGYGPNLGNLIEAYNAPGTAIPAMTNVAAMMRANQEAPLQRQQLQAQTQGTQAQIAATQQETSLKAAQVAADMKFGQAWADSGGDFGKLHSAMSEAAKSDPYFASQIPSYIQKINAYQQSIYSLGDAEAKNLGQKNDAILPLLGEMKSASEADRPAIRNKILDLMEGQPNLFPPEEIETVKSMPLDDKTVNTNYAAHQFQSQRIAERDTAAKELQATAEANKSNYTTVGGTLYDLRGPTPKPVLLPGTSTAEMNKTVDAIAPAGNALVGDLNTAARAQLAPLMARGDLQGANAVLSKLSEEVAKRNEATNPQMQAAAASKAAQETTARGAAEAPPQRVQSSAGRDWADLSSAPKAAWPTLEADAKAKGLPVVTDTKEAEDLHNLESAHRNLTSLSDAFDEAQANAKGPAERLWKAPETKLKQLFQVSPELGGIETLTKLGAPGLIEGLGGKARLTPQIIDLITEAMPKVTDTLPEAKAHFAALTTLLNNRVSGILGKEQGVTTGAAFKVPEGAPSAQGVPDGHQLKQGGKVLAIAKGGKWQAPPSQ